MARLGKKAEFRSGLRVTDAETLDIARMVLVGKVNRDIVSAINVHGPLAVGVSGEDAGLIQAAPLDPALGFVGEVTKVGPEIFIRLLAENLVPVVATIGTDESGQAYNINADTAAGAIAKALEAEKLVFFTDVEGIRADEERPYSLLSQLGAGELEELIVKGAVAGGMVPKARAALDAVNGGVAQAHILDGRAPHALLLEIFTRSGIGTMVRPVTHLMTTYAPRRDVRPGRRLVPLGRARPPLSRHAVRSGRNIAWSFSPRGGGRSVPGGEDFVAYLQPFRDTAR